MVDTGGAQRHPISTERLMIYWTTGPGGAKIAWGTDGSYRRCLTELGKHVKPTMVHGLCANLHKRATGEWPAGGMIPS